VQNFGGYIGGALAPTVTGFIVQSTGTFTPALITGSVVALAAAIIYWILVRQPIPALSVTPADKGAMLAGTPAE
jgi:cyanate permease